MRYRLRTLLIVLAVLPPLLWLGWTKYEAWRADQNLQQAMREIDLLLEREVLGMPVIAPQDTEERITPCETRPPPPNP